MERYGNRRPRVERLVSAWNRDIHLAVESEDGADDPLIGMSAEPSKRPRTRLTGNEVDAMRTARALGMSVKGIAERFGVTRQTVWEKTRATPGSHICGVSRGRMGAAVVATLLPRCHPSRALQ